MGQVFSCCLQSHKTQELQIQSSNPSEGDPLLRQSPSLSEKGAAADSVLVKTGASQPTSSQRDMYQMSASGKHALTSTVYRSIAKNFSEIFTQRQAQESHAKPAFLVFQDKSFGCLSSVAIWPVKAEKVDTKGNTIFQIWELGAYKIKEKDICSKFSLRHNIRGRTASDQASSTHSFSIRMLGGGKWHNLVPSNLEAPQNYQFSFKIPDNNFSFILEFEEDAATRSNRPANLDSFFSHFPL